MVFVDIVSDERIHFYCLALFGKEDHINIPSPLSMVKGIV
jgi:hypothetical protein